MLAGLIIGFIGLFRDSFSCQMLGISIIILSMIFGLGLEILDIKKRLKKVENKE